MSRYTIKSGSRTYAYGYDRPLGEYFFQGYDEEGDIIFSVSSYTTMIPHEKYPKKLHYSNGELIDLVKEEMGDSAPEEFLNAMALDITL